MLTLEQKQYIRNSIKGIYVIHLPHRTDRLINILNEIHKLENPEKPKERLYLKIIQGIRFENLHYLSGRAGNSAAMCKALTTAYQENLDNFLLLEDDAFFKDERLPSIYTALQNLEKINWDICFFGARIKSKMTDFGPGLYRIFDFGCQHCCLYNRKVIKYLIDLLPKWDAGYEVWMDWVNKYECYDKWVSNTLGQNTDFYCFHSKELVSFQLANFSDINQKDSDGIKILENDFEKYK